MNKKIPYIQVISSLAYTKMTLGVNDLGAAELKSPMSMPNMLCKTMSLYKALEQYGFYKRALYHLLYSSGQGAQLLGNGNLFDIMNEDDLYCYFLNGKIDVNKQIQAYTVPEFAEIFDVYTPTIHGVIDPFWDSNLSCNRMETAYRSINSSFLKYKRQWLWSVGDIIAHVTIPKIKGGFSFYLGCDGNIKINVFGVVDSSNTTRYYPIPYIIPYITWVKLGELDKILSSSDLFSLTSDGGLWFKFKEYAEHTKSKKLPHGFVDKYDGKISNKAATFLLGGLSRYLGMSRADAEMFIAGLLRFGTANKPLNYLDYIHGFYNLFKAGNDTRHYFVLNEIEHIAAEFIEYFNYTV